MTTTPATSTPSRAAILRLLDDAFVGPAWHGPSFLSSLRGVSAEEAAWRPAPGRHSIHDVALHVAYAKHRVALRLDPTSPKRFPRRLVTDWWPAPSSDADAWSLDRDLLESTHVRLIEVVERLPAARFSHTRPGKSHTLGEEAAGAALHDTYHAGQVRLLRRLYAS